MSTTNKSAALSVSHHRVSDTTISSYSIIVVMLECDWGLQPCLSPNVYSKEEKHHRVSDKILVENRQRIPVPIPS